jgi:poly-gamma-glutamate synthesis protein (capsule biosynthesis protein)
VHGGAALLLSVLVPLLLLACSKRPPAFAPGKARARILFVGDMSVARDVQRAIQQHGDDDPRWPFENVQPLLAGADMVFANLECVVSDSASEEATTKTFRIRALPRYAGKLNEVGIDIVSVANNHALDFGRQGFASTLDVLQNQGIIAVGVRHDGEETQRPVVVNVGNSRVGFLAYNQHGDEYKHPTFDREPFGYRLPRVVNDVREARRRNDADIIVISVHGGPELSHLPDEWQRTDARAVLDAGADVWIGHHPHVVQPVESYKGKLIVYSLGDFVFDKRTEWIRERTNPRFFLALDVENGQVLGHELKAGGHDRYYRPAVDDTFPIEPWTAVPPASTYVFSEHLFDAVVERERNGVPSPCKLEKNRPRTGNHELRWLRPRLACDGDASRPWQTVARSGELSGRVFRPGIWAVPHAGVLRLRFRDVPPGARLEGFAGVPDWGTVLAQERKSFAPITLRITSPTPEAVREVSVPIAAGWRSFSFDIDRVSAGEVTVEVAGGDGDLEQRFLFDAWVR